MSTNSTDVSLIFAIRLTHLNSINLPFITAFRSFDPYNSYNHQINVYNVDEEQQVTSSNTRNDVNIYIVGVWTKKIHFKLKKQQKLMQNDAQQKVTTDVLSYTHARTHNSNRVVIQDPRVNKNLKNVVSHFFL